MASFPATISGRHAHGVQSACSRILEKTLDRPVTIAVISFSLGIATLLLGGTAFGHSAFLPMHDTKRLGWHGSAEPTAPWLCSRSQSQRLGYGRPCTSADIGGGHISARRSFWRARFLRAPGGGDRTHSRTCADGDRHRACVFVLARVAERGLLQLCFKTRRRIPFGREGKFPSAVDEDSAEKTRADAYSHKDPGQGLPSSLAATHSGSRPASAHRRTGRRASGARRLPRDRSARASEPDDTD
jgi:hypothetical protein